MLLIKIYISNLVSLVVLLFKELNEFRLKNGFVIYNLNYWPDICNPLPLGFSKSTYKIHTPFINLKACRMISIDAESTEYRERRVNV
jgi:hypothetical protein